MFSPEELQDLFNKFTSLFPSAPKCQSLQNLHDWNDQNISWAGAKSEVFRWWKPCLWHDKMEVGDDDDDVDGDDDCDDDGWEPCIQNDKIEARVTDQMYQWSKVSWVAL